MRSFLEKYLDNINISSELLRLIRKISEYKGMQELFKRQSPEILENLRQVAIIQSTVSSNRIERVIAEPNRIKALMKETTVPQNRSEAEIAGYRDVLNTIHTSALNIPFTEKVVQQFHRDMMKYTGLEGGKWKSTQNEIAEIYPNGSKKIRFVPVEPYLINNYMIELHKLYNKGIETQKYEPLILIPLYVFDFLCIHPFLDGNGRIARIIAILLLYQQGYEVGRYISLERLIENTKESYYETLEYSSRGWYKSRHDPEPWITYFLSSVLAAYNEFEKRATIIIGSKGRKTDMIINAIDNFLGDFRIADIEEICPLASRDLIRYVLKKLKKEGKIINLIKGRKARYRKIIE